MNIVLFGIKSSGKTTIGKKLGAKLTKAFIDTDHLIEKTYALYRDQRLTTYQIYQQVDPVTFRTLEYKMIQSLQNVQNSIIAVGGGAMLFEENIEALKKKGQLVYLFCEKEPLKKRILHNKPLPPFLDPNNPDTSFEAMYEQRNRHYRKIEALQINVTKMKDKEIIDTICNEIENGKQ